MDVKIIRFLNGEEVIGKITEKKGKYTIEKGAVIVPVGEQQLGMVPWLPHAEDNTVTVDESKVAFVFTPLTDLANQYFWVQLQLVCLVSTYSLSHNKHQILSLLELSLLLYLK